MLPPRVVAAPRPRPVGTDTEADYNDPVVRTEIDLTLVVQRPPCGACQVIEQLLRESLERAVGEDSRLRLSIREIHHPSQLRSVEGLEVEKMPAVLLGGEQVCAGRILTIRDIREYVDELDSE
jgi:hypothetical protein